MLTSDDPDAPAYSHDSHWGGFSSDKMIRLFARAGGLIGSSLDEQENLQNLEKLLIPQITDSMTVWLLDENHQLQAVRSSSPPPHEGDDWKDSQLPTQVVRSGLSIREDEYCCLPLRVRHQVIGALECHNRGHRLYEADDMIILEEIASRTAIAFENSRLYQTLKHTEIQLRDAKLQAESASRTKSQFLANMSHEIRTPLGAILGFVDLMLSPGENQQDCALWGQKIKKNGKHLLRLIDEILDLSKIESGHLEIATQNVQTTDFIHEIHLTMIAQAVQKGIHLNFKLESAIPSTIQTDPTRLRQILFNLIGNAIKFTDQGSVEVSISYQPLLDLLSFSIADTGIGLTEEQSLRLFRPFSQGDPSHTRRFGGTGLGLTLSRDLSRMLGGNVELIRTSPNAGSTFQVTIAGNVPAETPFIGELLPFERKAPSKASTPPQKLSGLKILLVEDSADNQFLISRFLKSAGAEIEVAEDGARGLEKAMRGDHDLILMDIQMPLLNGHQVTRILRQNGDSRPILALTAHALKEELEKSLAAGCNDHLTKPIDRAKLVDLVAYHGKKPLKGAIESSTRRVNMSGFHGDVRSP